MSKVKRKKRLPRTTNGHLSRRQRLLYWVAIPIICALIPTVVCIYWVPVNHPNIIGRIYSVNIGDMVDYSNNQRHTCFIAFVSLTNSSESSIQILDYKLEVDTGYGFSPIDRTYNLQQLFQKSGSLNIETAYTYIEAPDIINNIARLTEEPIEYGTAIHAILLFPTVADKTDYYGKDEIYRLTITDILNNTHAIENTKYSFINNDDQLSEIFGINIAAKPLGEPGEQIVLWQIPEPEDLSRSIFHPQGTFRGPFYKGVGNIDLVSSDGTIFAQNIINGQLKNIVFVSPVTGKYYEQENIPNFSEDYTVQTTTGNFYFTDSVFLRGNVAIVGSND